MVGSVCWPFTSHSPLHRVVSLPLGFFSLSPLVVTVRLTPFISRTDECNEWGAAEWVTRGRDGWEWDGNGKRPTAPHSSLRLSLRSFLGSHVTRLISSSSLHIETRENEVSGRMRVTRDRGEIRRDRTKSETEPSELRTFTTHPPFTSPTAPERRVKGWWVVGKGW